MGDFPFIPRYWAQGKQADKVKDCPVITNFNLPGDIFFSYIQVPAASSLEYKSGYDSYILIEKGYGILEREGDLKGNFSNGMILHVEKEKMHKVTNNSLTESLEILVIHSKK